MPKDHKTYAIAYMHPGEVSHSFHRSMQQLWMWDLTHQQRCRGYFEEQCGAGRLIEGRNSAVRKFLATDIEWLLFVDADMGFEADGPDRLLDAADQYRRPVVGGLCFGQKKVRQAAANARVHEPIPTLYQWEDSENGLAGYATVYDYPRDRMVQVDGTGCAFLLIHRRALEKVRDTFEFPYPREWFDDTIYKGRVFGEDLTFSRRLREADIPIYVHTGVKTSHYKTCYLEEGILDAQDVQVPTWVVVPFKDRADLTDALVNQLVEQGGWRGLLLYDNGSEQPQTAKAVKRWKQLAGVEVFDADGANIHQMWNAGLNHAQSKSPARFNVAILNNDISLGDRFCEGLAEALRSEPNLGVVSPNYDGRNLEGLEYTSDICASRYDGSGGIAGFAFMLKGEAGYRFPTDLQWWYGDSDMVASVVAGGSRAAIVGGVTCTHEGGGTADWDDPAWQDVLTEDRARFQAKWGSVQEFARSS